MVLTSKSITLIPDSGVKIPDGKAWIGDPCYVFPDTHWSNLCSLMFPREAPNAHLPAVHDKDGAEVTVEVDGKEYKFWIIGTAFGDGVYNLTKDGASINDLGVDAGLLSVIPLSTLEAWGGTPDHLGATVELKKAVLSASEGNFTLQSPTGEFQVITDGSEDDVEEPYEDDFDDGLDDIDEDDEADEDTENDEE